MAHTKHTQIISSTPGRTRIRVSPKRRNPDEMHRIAHRIEQKPGVHDVRADIRTGSIIVHHGPEVSASIPSVLKDLGVILSATTNLDIPGVERKSDVASNLTDAVVDLNRRLGLATNGAINLRTLIPLGLGTVAVIQLLRRGLQIEAAPWYVFAYAAFDIFVKLHYARENTITSKPGQA